MGKGRKGGTFCVGKHVGSSDDQGCCSKNHRSHLPLLGKNVKGAVSANTERCKGYPGAEETNGNLGKRCLG